MDLGGDLEGKKTRMRSSGESKSGGGMNSLGMRVKRRTICLQQKKRRTYFLEKEGKR